MDLDDEIREFLIESHENLAVLDREIIELEKNPRDMKLVSSAFRTIHTIKGTCGFFGYEVLGAVAHVTENLLSQVREGQRELTPGLISLLLEAIDSVKMLLATIEATGGEGEDQTGALRARLEQAHREVGAEGGTEAAVAAASMEALQPDRGLPLEDCATGGRVEGETEEQAPGQVIMGTAFPAARPAPIRQVGASGLLPAAEARVVSSLDAGMSVPTVRGAEGDLEPSREAQLADSTIRVDVALLNRLMNLVGELVLARNQLLQDTSAKNSSLQQTSQRLNQITSELQEGVMKTRMQPIGVVWNKLPRIVRDLAAQCGKRVQIEMEGANTELDKTIIEAIKDPLTHIVRNACDHGIEQPEVRVGKGKRPEGLLTLRAYHEGGVVNIEIRDDGAGIDAERVKRKAIDQGLIRAEQAAGLSERDAIHMIFQPGFSTAATITSVSGRGVGMDVVKTNIEKIGGSVEMQNRAEGSGTTIRIKIPLTLAIIPGLVVTVQRPASARAGGDAGIGEAEREAVGLQAQRRGKDIPGRSFPNEDRFIIPQANLLELVHLEGPEQLRRIRNVHGTAVFHHRDKLLPLVYLNRVLGWKQDRDKASDRGEAVNIIVVQAENRQMGLVVDRICDTQEIVVKPLGRQLKSLICYVGATIMGDGQPALILDVAGLARLAGLSSQPRSAVQPEETRQQPTAVQPRMMLLFRAGSHERLAVPLALVDRLEEIQVARVERAGGRPVLYYRGEILPLIDLAVVLEPTSKGSLLGNQAQVIVFASNGRRLGLVVEQILDIVDEPITAEQPIRGIAGLLGSAVIGGRITDLVDLDGLVGWIGETWQEPPSGVIDALLLQSAPAARSMVGVSQ